MGVFAHDMVSGSGCGLQLLSLKMVSYVWVEFMGISFKNDVLILVN